MNEPFRNEAASELPLLPCSSSALERVAGTRLYICSGTEGAGGCWDGGLALGPVACSRVDREGESQAEVVGGSMVARRGVRGWRGRGEEDKDHSQSRRM